MKYLLIILICLVSFFSKAQTTFEKVYSDSGITTAYDIIATLDGGYAATGFKTCASFGCQDFFLLKLDSLGNQEWVRLYDGFTANDVAYAIVQTTDSGYVMSGRSATPPNLADNFRIMKVDKNGDEIWDKNYGGLDEETAWDVIETFDKGFIMATQNDTAAGLLKIDSLGILEWQKDYTHFVGAGYAVKQCADSSFVLTGAANNAIDPTSGNDIFLLKTDKNGDTLWTKYYGQGYERGEDVIVTSAGDFVIAGYTNGITSIVGVYIIKTDNMGNTLWTNIYESNDQAYSTNLIEDNQGNYVVVGNSAITTPVANNDLYVLKINSSGSKIWERTFEYQANADDNGQGIALAHDGGYVMCGLTSSALGQVYIVKTDTAGLIVGIEDIDNPEFTLNVYPNPFNNYTTIDFSELYNGDNITIELYDFTGKLLFQQTVNEAKTTLYNQGYAKGMYLLTIKDKNQLLTTKKLIIN